MPKNKDVQYHGWQYDGGKDQSLGEVQFSAKER